MLLELCNDRPKPKFLSINNDKAAFRTPLATLHGKNGWADVFLTTPSGGLQDAYIFTGTTLPCGINAKTFFHWFCAEESGGDYGEEFDVVLSKSINKNLSVLAKYASFNGNGSYVNRSKFWLQTELKF